MTARKFDNFDKYAENYRNTHDKAIEISGADSDYFSEYKIMELLKFENPKQTLRVLDFGCGDGNSTVYIRKYFPNAIIIGVDVSEVSIDIAHKKGIANTIFKFFDGVKLPFEDNGFDVVFTSMVFHHIEHKLHESVLKEIYRVLKKGGRFYNFEHNPNNPLTRRVVRACEFDEDAVLLKPSYAKEITNNSGLKTEKLNYTLFFPRHKIFNFFLGLEKMLTWCPIGAQYYIRAIK
jgi:ubiquinone/menaquinone biosynthesis C-methylase UbiE